MSFSPLFKSQRRSPASLVLESLGISQAKLAQALGVSTTSLSRMLRGEQPCPPGLETALRASVGAAATERVLSSIEEAGR